MPLTDRRPTAEGEWGPTEGRFGADASLQNRRRDPGLLSYMNSQKRTHNDQSVVGLDQAKRDGVSGLGKALREAKSTVQAALGDPPCGPRSMGGRTMLDAQRQLCARSDDGTSGNRNPNLARRHGCANNQFNGNLALPSHLAGAHRTQAHRRSTGTAADVDKVGAE